MITQERIWQLMVNSRIACPQAGYPASEALYPSIEAWQRDTGISWDAWVERFA
jgi:hypothetical protein